MSETVLLQAGHASTLSPFHPNGGGAPGEAEWTPVFVEALADRLRTAFVEPVPVGHWFGFTPPSEATGRDYHGAFFFHYDADIYAVRSGAFCDRYRPLLATARALRGDPHALASDSDQTVAGHARALARRGVLPDPTLRRTFEGLLRAPEPGNPNADVEEHFISVFKDIYPKRTGIQIHEERRNANTWDYYGYAATTAATPGILAELAVGMGDDHEIVTNHIGQMADAFCECILAWLAVAPPPPPPAPEPVLTPDQQAILEIMTNLGASSAAIGVWLSRLGRTVEIGRALDVPRLSVATRRQLAQELQRMNDNA